jgi:hypothetical protein
MAIMCCYFSLYACNLAFSAAIFSSKLTRGGVAMKLVFIENAFLVSLSFFYGFSGIISVFVYASVRKKPWVCLTSSYLDEGNLSVEPCFFIC